MSLGRPHQAVRKVTSAFGLFEGSSGVVCQRLLLADFLALCITPLSWGIGSQILDPQDNILILDETSRWFFCQQDQTM